MELWIRSQDKMELFNAKDIWIPNDADTSIWGQDGLRKTALGFYKTTERALEVLDEIQKHIAMNLELNGTHQECEFLIKAKTLEMTVRIFEMPKE